MNAFLFGLAAVGALLVIGTRAPAETVPVEIVSAPGDPGSMTRDYSINPETGELEETAIIAFSD